MPLPKNIIIIYKFPLFSISTQGYRILQELTNGPTSSKQGLITALNVCIRNIIVGLQMQIVLKQQQQQQQQQQHTHTYTHTQNKQTNKQ